MKINRSTLYYKRKGESDENVTIMKKMKEIYNDRPTAGVLTMQSVLSMQGYTANVKRVRRLMKLIGIKAIFPHKKLSVLGQAEYKHPYLLRGLDIDHRNHVWSTDISYIPMKRGFMYLYAIIDVYSRYIVGWRLSNTLESSNCTELRSQARSARNHKH